MDASVIDTLRYASRLRAAGVEPQQAEAMSRALSDEIGGGVATKGDLEHAVDGLTGEIVRVERELKGDVARVESELARVESELARMEGEVKEDIGQLDGRLVNVEGELKRLDGRINTLDTKGEGPAAKFDTQGRYVFLVLALIAALGLYNAVSPRLATRFSQTGEVQAAAPAPAEAPGPKEQQPSAQP